MRSAMLWSASILAVGLSFVSVDAKAAGEDSLDEALEQDLTPIPASDGAVFIPSLTSPDAEPPVIVYHAGERVASGSTGQRITLPPGSYRLSIGSESDAMPATVDVVVTRGRTTTVTPFFGGVRVALVGVNGEAVAGDYVIATAKDRVVVGRGKIDPKSKASARTHIVPPGEYVVVYGSSASSLDNSFALRVGGGDVIRYRLVADGDQIVRSEFGDAPVQSTESVWNARWIVGASGSATRSTNTLATVQGDAFLIDLFSRFEGGIRTKQHAATLRLNVDQRLIGLEERTGWKLPLRPVTNEVEGELFYTFRLGGIVGPYARALGRTALFATNVRAPQQLDVVTIDAAQNEIGRTTVAAQNNVRLFEPLAPLQFVEDAGLAVSVIDNDVATIGVRGGPGFRQAYFGSGRFIRETNGSRLLLQRLDDSSQFGGVGTGIAELRLFSTLTVSSRFDAFVAASQLDGTIVPVFRWDNTAAIRIGRYASVAYTFSLRRDDVALPELQSLQGLQLRASYGLF